MKKSMCFVLVLVALLWGNAVYADSTTLGYHNFPPYEYMLNDKPDGVMLDIIPIIFKRAQVPFDLKFLPFKRALKEIDNGKIDGLFIFYKTPERMKIIDYSEPIVESSLVFFVRKDSDLKFEKLEDLKGKKIGALLGYKYSDEFDVYTDFKRDDASTHETNLKKLSMGRTDAYICDKTVGIYTAVKENVMSELKILPIPLKVRGLYMGFTKGKHRDVINKINPIIKSMTASGEIDKIIDEFITKKK